MKKYLLHSSNPLIKEKFIYFIINKNNIEMKFLSFIKAQDFLGERINFSINNQSNFQTVVGGFICIFIYVLYVIFFYYFGIDFLFKENPNTTYQLKDLYHGNSLKLVNITNDNFLFAIRFEDYYGNPVEIEEYSYPAIFIRNETYIDKNKTTTESDKELKLVNCRRYQEFFNENSNSIYNLTEWKCPDFTKSEDSVQLGGYWDDRSVLSLKLELRFCTKNNTNDCKNITSISVNSLKDEKLYVSLIYPEILFNSDNFENPFSFRFINYWNLLSPKIKYTDILYIGYNYLNEDIGFMFESINELQNISCIDIDSKIDIINENNADSSKNDKSDIKIYSLSVHLNKYYNYYTRKYMKLQDLLGNVYGSIDLITFIFGIFYKLYNKYRLETYLFNRLVYINENRNKDNNKSNGYYRELDKTYKISNYEAKLSNSISPENIIKSNKSLNYINVNFENDLENLQKRNQNTSRIAEFPFIKSINFDNSPVQKNFINNNNNKLYFKKKSNFEISNYLDNNDIYPKAENPISSRKLIKSDFLKGLKLKREIINKQINNHKNFHINKNNNNESNVTEILNKSHENFLINENEMKNILSRLKEKKNLIIFKILDYLKYICFSKSCNIKNKNHLNIYRHLELVLEKTFEKFDIFAYLKKLKFLELLDELLLNQEQTFFVNLISHRPYKIDLSSNLMKNEEEISQDNLQNENDGISCFKKLLNSQLDNKNHKILDHLLS